MNPAIAIFQEEKKGFIFKSLREKHKAQITMPIKENTKEIYQLVYIIDMVSKVVFIAAQRQIKKKFFLPLEDSFFPSPNTKKSTPKAPIRRMIKICFKLIGRLNKSVVIIVAAAKAITP